MKIGKFINYFINPIKIFRFIKFLYKIILMIFSFLGAIYIGLPDLNLDLTTNFLEQYYIIIVNSIKNSTKWLARKILGIEDNENDEDIPSSNDPITTNSVDIDSKSTDIEELPKQVLI